MIYLSGINDGIINRYINLPSKNIFAVRVKSLLASYGGYPRLIDVWYQQIKQKTTAYIVRCGGEFIADIYSGADASEIIDLCRLAGGAGLLCKKLDVDSINGISGINSINNINSINGETGVIMRLSRLASFEMHRDFSENISLKEYYSLLKANEASGFAVPAFDDFYVDLNHRLRKGAARVLGCYKGGVLVSACAATAVFGNSAVIAGVSTLPPYKGQGCGTAAVTELCRRMIGENITEIYLQRDKSKNYSFYHKIGFDDIGEFTEINF